MPIDNNSELGEIRSEDIEKFISSKFSKSEQTNLKVIEDTAIDSGPMSENCRLVFNIASLHSEKGVAKTLLSFLNIKTKEKDPNFEIIILINGPDGTDIKNSIAYKEAMTIKSRYHELKITIAESTYPKEELTISRVRKDLGGLTLKRAAKTDRVDIANLILVTQDADLININDEYVNNVVEEFDKHPKLEALTGFIDHPYEDFYSDHLFLTTQRFTDALEVITRSKYNNFPLRGGNSAFRVKSYMEAGGHESKRRLWEHMDLNRKMRLNDPSAVKFSGKKAQITTSARRQIVAIDKGVLLNDRYKTFGKDGDLAEEYQKPITEIQIPEQTHKVTSKEFTSLLEKELQSIYAAKLKIEEKTSTKENSRIEQLMKRTAFFIGISIHFKDGKVIIDDISKLKEQIIKKYSHF